MKSLIYTIIFICLPFRVFAQEKLEAVPFGDMEQWAVRYITESRLLGGATKEIYALGPVDTLYGNNAYDFSRTIWGVSNAYANVVGVAKAANTLYPEKRGKGWCARLEAKMETVRVLGLVDIKVAIAGSLFLGRVIEPVRSANDPYGSVSYGIPFSGGKPKALVYDVKVRVSPEQTLTKALGLGSSQVKGHDEPQLYVFLQKRWEDEQGNIYAKRVGTAFRRFPKTIEEWENNSRLEIHYGDLSSVKSLEVYNQWFPMMDTYRSINSKGKLVEVQEVGFAKAEEAATHIMIMFSAGCHSAFYAHLGNCLWIDNVRLAY